MRRIRVLALCCAVLLILSLSAVQAQAPPPQRGGTIRVGITQEIINLDPHVATAFSSFQVMDLVYESLLRLNPKTLEVEPNLATSWSVSA
ncbi:MAG: ABC transporter substrate-binding protein, partial [bacterium]